MGYLRPVALIVNDSGYGNWAERAHTEAVRIFGNFEDELDGVALGACVSELSRPLWNGTSSFCIFWDGSKEGWDPSERGDLARAEFVGWLRAQAYDDGSSPLDWIEVQYGGDDREAVVLAHGDQEGVGNVID